MELPSFHKVTLQLSMPPLEILLKEFQKKVVVVLLIKFRPYSIHSNHSSAHAILLVSSCYLKPTSKYIVLAPISLTLERETVKKEES